MKKQAEPTLPTAPPLSKPHQFTDAAGVTHIRRGDITMGEYRQYGEDVEHELYELPLEVFWVLYFLGRYHPDALRTTIEQRIELGRVGMDAITTDEYYAIRSVLFRNITNPAVSPNVSLPA